MAAFGPLLPARQGLGVWPVVRQPSMIPSIHVQAASTSSRRTNSAELLRSTLSNMRSQAMGPRAGPYAPSREIEPDLPELNLVQAGFFVHQR